MIEAIKKILEQNGFENANTITIYKRDNGENSMHFYQKGEQYFLGYLSDKARKEIYNLINGEKQ